MSGNVWEWCEDFAGTSYRRLRGGSLFHLAEGCTVANRDSFIIPDYRFNFIGFRLARSPGN
jgi:formylglycine-generating enzyme required for sulfatase activity